MEAISRLYSQEAEDMVIFAARVLDDRVLAEDAVQETFITAIRCSDRLLSSPSPVGWIYNTLKNTMLHIMRDRERLRRHIQPLSSAESFPTEDSHQNMEKPFQGSGISEAELSLLSGFYLDGIPLKETADKLGISYDACRQKIRRARLHLENAIGAEDTKEGRKTAK